MSPSTCLSIHCRAHSMTVLVARALVREARVFRMFMVPTGPTHICFSSSSASGSTHEIIPREAGRSELSVIQECGYGSEERVAASVCSPANEEMHASLHVALKPSTELSLPCERDLLFEAIESLRIAAEDAILRAEKAEAQLSELREAKAAEETMQRLCTTAEAAILHAETVEAQLKDETAASIGETQLGASSVRLEAMQHAIRMDLQKYIAEEVKGAVNVAVTEATFELRTVTAEAHKLQKELAGVVESQRCCADGQPVELSCTGKEAHGIAGSPVPEASWMLAMKCAATKDALIGGDCKSVGCAGASTSDASDVSSDSLPTGDATSTPAASILGVSCAEHLLLPSC